MVFYTNSSLTQKASLTLTSKLQGKTIAKCRTRLHWLSTQILEEVLWYTAIFLWTSYWKPHHPVMNRCKSLLKPILLDELKKKKSDTQPRPELNLQKSLWVIVKFILFLLLSFTWNIKFQPLKQKLLSTSNKDIAVILSKLLCIELKCTPWEQA